MKFQNCILINFEMERCTNGRTHAHMDKPKAICPFNFSKVGGINIVTMTFNVVIMNFNIVTINFTFVTVIFIQITIDMVKKAISKMKSGKAAGPSGIVEEMIKAAGDTGAIMICNLATASIGDGKVPSDWEQSFIVCLYKGRVMLWTEETIKASG